MSFVFVSLRQQSNPPNVALGRVRNVSRLIRWPLRALGLIAWMWIMAQAFFGGNDPAADVGQIFLWIYGWIGVALISALWGPIWAWLDPFSTMHMLLVGAGRRLRLLSTPDAGRRRGRNRPAVPGAVGQVAGGCRLRHRRSGWSWWPS